MSGFQFIHFENYARSPREKITGKGGIIRPNKKVWGVKEILAEASREVGACPHVDNPKVPRVVYGCSIDELAEMHDQVENAVQTRKDGKTRKIIKTQNTLATSVLSYPVPVAVIKNSKEEQEKYYEWRRRSVGFMEGLWGDDFKCAVQHLDEKFPHLHCYGLAPDWKANDLHPGLAVVPSKGKKGRDAGKEAIDALRAVQDRYQREVGAYCALTRLGPGRRRLSRSDWKQEKAQQEALQATLNKSEEIRAEYREEATREAQIDFAEQSWGVKVVSSVAGVKKQKIEDAKKEGREEIQQSLDAITSEKNSLKKQVSKLSKDLKQSQNDLYEKTAPDREAKKREEFYQMMVERLVDHDIDMGVNPIDKLKEIQQMEDIPKTLSDFVNAIIEMIAQALGLPLEQSSSYTLKR